MTDLPIRPGLGEILESMGEAGARISEIDAAEAGAGNISVYLGWDTEVRRRFPLQEEIELPCAAPSLAGGTILVTGSGRRLRQIVADPEACVGAVKVHDGGTTATLFTSPRRLFAKLTSEFNSHLGVHEDQVARRGVNFQAVVHAQPGAEFLGGQPDRTDDVEVVEDARLTVGGRAGRVLALGART